ncbi:MAG TPA: TetR/AcrR family transcriptional regulator [Sphingopyxis sp.]|uniref:TetR/AcrR family transcriptional regulator n=1 Tax=Sphingopyxis sp. TaxID=1908224 RepID=UPI002E355FB9|nr:TetR/AcrR family transcriptional regulator [Sphingopyxis sp.]HEX2814390.1 TetR/AcrR family transcriptional regulator [Sphingopyxis sp.]
MSEASKVSFPRRTAAKARTRQRIEEAARRLFVTLGYGDATMAAIAEAADIHITTLFTHFASKRELAAAIAVRAGERFEEIVAMQRAQGVPVLAFWRNQVARIAHAYERDGDGQINLGRALAGEPELLPVWYGHQRLQIDLMTDYIADELGIDATKDGRAQMAAAMLVAGGRMAFDSWMESGGAGDLVAENERLLDAAEALLAGGLPLIRRDAS